MKLDMYKMKSNLQKLKQNETRSRFEDDFSLHFQCWFTMGVGKASTIGVRRSCMKAIPCRTKQSQQPLFFLLTHSNQFLLLKVKVKPRFQASFYLLWCGVFSRQCCDTSNNHSSSSQHPLPLLLWNRSPNRWQSHVFYFGVSIWISIYSCLGFGSVRRSDWGCKGE